MEERNIAFTWMTEPESVEERCRELQQAGAEAEIPRPSGFVVPILVPVIIGVITLLTLAQFVYQVIQNERRPGLIIDVRKGKVDVREERSLDHGVMLVITSQGVSQYDTRVEPFSEETYQALLEKAIASES